MKNVIIAIAFVLALTINAIAQSIPLSTDANIKFSFGGNEDQVLTAAQAPDGSIYIGGLYMYGSPDSVVLHPAIAKFSASGIKLWQVIDTVGTFSPLVAIAEDGVYWATDARTLKLNGSGKILWATQSAYQGVAAFSDTLVGINVSAFGPTPITVFFPDGKIVRTFSIPCPTAQLVHSAIIKNGYLYIASQYHGGNVSSVSGQVVKVNLATGAIVWRHQYVDVIRIYCDVDDQGNAYTAGTLYLDRTTGAMQFDMSKLSPDDSVIWEDKWFARDSSAAANANNWVNGIAYNSNGDVTMVGAVQRGEAQNDGHQNAYAFCRKASNGDSLWVIDRDLDTTKVSISSYYNTVTCWNGKLSLIGDVFYDPYGNVPMVDYLQIYDDLTPVGEHPPVAQNFSLSQNYPNPFNPSTRIEYGVDRREYVTLTVYNVLGQKVETLVDGYQDPGEHQVIFDASRLPSGTYFYRLQAGSFSETKKMILMK